MTTAAPITVTLADATESQLRQIAQEQLGLTVPANAKPDTIRAKIAAASDKTKFTVTVGKVEQPLPQPKAQVMRESRPGFPDPVPEPMYTIIIDAQDTDGGDEPVPVNPGRNMWIPRGKECRVKHRYVHVLQNAVRTVYDQPEDSKGPLVPRQVLAYPVRIVQAPSQAELDAWSKYKADLQAAEVAEAKAKARAA